MTHDFIDDVEEQKKMCKAAGCIDGLVTKDDLERLKPSMFWEIAKVVISVVGCTMGPVLVFYGKFAVLESQMEMVLKALKLTP